MSDVEQDAVNGEEQTPQTSEQAEPKILAVLVPDASKDGDILKFTVQTRTKAIDTSEKGVIVLRQYEDFEFLLHCLRAHCDTLGLVVPPLPPRPVVTPASTEAKTKKQLGSSSKTMAADEFTKECRFLERFLQSLVDQPIFRASEHLRNFLLKDEAPLRAGVKKGILNSLTKAVDEARFHHHKDLDDEFQSYRSFADEYSFLIKTCNANFIKLNNADQRLSSGLSNVITGLNGLLSADSSDADLSRSVMAFTKTLEEFRIRADQCSYDDADSIGFELQQYTRHLDAAKEMLFHRTCKMVEYENALKALDKSTPKTVEKLELNKAEKEKAYEDITELAKGQIDTFHKKRISHFQDALIRLAEANINNAQGTNDMLQSAVDEIKAFH